MLGREGPNRLQLNNDAVVADKICDVRLPKQLALVAQAKGPMRVGRQAAPRELDLETFLIDGFQKARAMAR